jgi:microcystin-dependent protein
MGTTAILPSGLTPAAFATALGFPSGIVLPHAGAAVPDGWVLCDGAAVSRTTYAYLFAAIGTAYGAGDESTTFNVPDFKGRTILGAGAGSGLTSRARGDKSGGESKTIGANNLPTHTHASGGNVGAEASHTHGVSITSGTVSADHTHSFSANTSTSSDHQHTAPMKWGSNSSHNHSSGGGYGAEAPNPTSGDGTAVTTSGNGSHYHSVSGTSGYISANHTHSVSGTSAAGSSHVHTDPATGNNSTTATAQDVMNPYGVAQYIIKI